MFKKVFISCLSLLIILSMLSIPTTTKASGIDNLEGEKQKLKQNFLEMGIEEETAEKLVEKVMKGELLDSQKETELKEQEDQLVVDTDDEPKFIEFDDGSRIMLSLEEESTMNQQDISGSGMQLFDYATGRVTINKCTTGSGYKNCSVKVRYYDGIWDIYFNAKIGYVQGHYDSITSISKQGVDAVLYSVTQKKFKILKKKENSSGPAKAEFTNQFSHKTGLYTLSRSLTLYVGKDKSYARLNYY